MHLWMAFSAGEGKSRENRLFQRAIELSIAGRNDEAIAVFGEAITLDPKGGVGYAAYCARGMLLAEAGRFEEATADYQAATALGYDGYDGRATTLRGLILLCSTGRADEAIPVWQEVAAKDDLARGLLETVTQPLGENKEPGYTRDTRPFGFADTSQKRMGDDLNIKVKKAKAENLARAKSRPSTHQLATYRALVRNVDLLNPKLPESERLTRARRLVRAYHRVRECRPKFHDRNEQLQAAFSIVNRHEYQQKLRREAALKLAVG
jgi:tetratricopeptide (TPR) repeat protein